MVAAIKITPGSVSRDQEAGTRVSLRVFADAADFAPPLGDGVKSDLAMVKNRVAAALPGATLQDVASRIPGSHAEFTVTIAGNNLAELANILDVAAEQKAVETALQDKVLAAAGTLATRNTGRAGTAKIETTTGAIASI